jgi:hypothetical protein
MAVVTSKVGATLGIVYYKVLKLCTVIEEKYATFLLSYIFAECTRAQ